MYPKEDVRELILLYGGISKSVHPKQQRMIDGGATCGYREYAENFGKIIYLCKQQVKLPWEYSMTNPHKVVQFLNKRPNAIVWSVKHDPAKDSLILRSIKNKKLYYSCNSKNSINLNCDVSLVDTPQRLRKNAKLHLKGKDPNYWKPGNGEKVYDYLLMGKRGDKNEIYFINQLTQQVKQ